MIEAVYIIVIARATGWTEDHIRWELPLTRGWAYYHAARLLDGRPMRWPESLDPATEGWWDRVKKTITTVRQRISK